MKDDSLQKYQYNSCVSRGICSVSPKIAALQNVLILYLHLISKYYVKLISKDLISKDIQLKILDIMGGIVLFNDFSEEYYFKKILFLRNSLLDMIDLYNITYSQDDFQGEKISEANIFKRSKKIVDTIQLGEEIGRSISLNFKQNIRDLYKLILIVLSNLSLNLTELGFYGAEFKDGVDKVFNLLSTIDLKKETQDNLKNKILDASTTNIELMYKLYQELEKHYGEQENTQVSFSTFPQKAILVTGSNIKELENILENIKETEIDIYTHDEMIFAYTFPKFRQYKNLKGQYGYGLENCLIDFATFPGPIILTKNSIHNVDNLYRGRLFTTDENFNKEISKIKNYNLDEVIEATKASKGFKHGKKCDSLEFGYNWKTVLKQVTEKIKSSEYKRIFLITEKNFSEEQEIYFKSLLKLTDKDTLVISMSYFSKRDNLLYFNTCFDPYASLRLINILKNYDLPIVLFVPKCSRNTLSEILYLSNVLNVKIFLGECIPTTINPTLKSTLKDVFGINSLTDAKTDFQMALSD